MFLTESDDYALGASFDPRGGRRADRKHMGKGLPSDMKQKKITQSGNYWFLAANDGEDYLDEDETSDPEDGFERGRAIRGVLESPEYDDESGSESDELEWDSEDYEDSDSSLEGLLLDSEGDDDVFEPDNGTTVYASGRSLDPNLDDGGLGDKTLVAHKGLGAQELQHIMTTTPPLRGQDEYNWPWLD